MTTFRPLEPKLNRRVTVKWRDAGARDAFNQRVPGAEHTAALWAEERPMSAARAQEVFRDGGPVTRRRQVFVIRAPGPSGLDTRAEIVDANGTRWNVRGVTPSAERGRYQLVLGEAIT